MKSVKVGKRCRAWLLGICGLICLWLVVGLMHLYCGLHRYDTLIAEAALAHNLDPALIRAVIWRETRFRAASIGRHGEVGLMQVTPNAAAEWAAAQGREPPDAAALIRPEVNIQAGAWYLGRAMHRWREKDDPVPYALAEYNAGHSNALRWSKDDGNRSEHFIRQITYPGTRRYVEAILERYRPGL